jgi:hypothetical protein
MKQATRHGWPLRPAGNFYLATEYTVDDEYDGPTIYPVDRDVAVYNLDGRTGRDAESIWIARMGDTGGWQVDWHIQLGGEEEWDDHELPSKKEAIEFVRNLMWKHYKYSPTRSGDYRGEDYRSEDY